MRRWRVVRFALAADPALDERLRSEPDIELTVAPFPKRPEDVTEALKDADVYHVASARNEMSTHTFVTAEFLQKFPNLLAVSTYGAGYDSVDVEACTRAGVAVTGDGGRHVDQMHHGAAENEAERIGVVGQNDLHHLGRRLCGSLRGEIHPEHRIEASPETAE